MAKKIIQLSEDFIQKATQTPPKWGALGWITYKRTYARWDELKQRNEEFHETLKRVIEGNINLDPRLEGKPSKKLLAELTKEAEELFLAFYSLQALPPGRGLWISGTEFAEKHGDALNNCWFVSVYPQKYGESEIVPSYATKDDVLVSMPFSFLFDQSMKGGGVGFSVSKTHVDKIPAIVEGIDLKVVSKKTNADFDKMPLDGEEPTGKEDLVFLVPDSREGWVEALALVIDAHFGTPKAKSITIDVTDIRPEGARIKGFGGIASGAKPLVELLHWVNNLLNGHVGERMTSVMATDIMNYIGKTVVAGNVRRTAEIALGDASDNDFVTMKQDQEALYSHRWASNNTVLIDENFYNYDPIAAAISKNGEPGIGNLYLARNFGRIIDGFNPQADPDVDGWNPCGEITLENGENCNLVEIFPSIIEREGGDINKIIALAVRYAKRVTFSKYDWEVTRKVVEKNRRIGVSISGIQDWVLTSFDKPVVVGWDFGILNDGTPYKKPIYNKELIAELDRMYKITKDADLTYSKELGCNPSVKITTVKPSGTVALLPGVSPGVHWNYAAYQIRRIRFQKNDPLVELLKSLNYIIEDDVYSANTVVCEFYVKSPSADNPHFKSAGDVSLEEQIAVQALIQMYWADNSVSCTITFKEEEKPLIATYLRAYKGVIKSTSMLPYSGHGYKQAPYEPITKEEFEGFSKFIFGKPEEFAGMNVDERNAKIAGIDECSGGACPIR